MKQIISLTICYGSDPEKSIHFRVGKCTPDGDPDTIIKSIHFYSSDCKWYVHIEGDSEYFVIPDKLYLYHTEKLVDIRRKDNGI